MEVHRLEREFLYNGVKLPDTTPTMTPEQVQKSLRLRLNWFTSLFVRSERKG